MSKNINKLVRRVLKTRDDYKSAVERLEYELKDLVEFEFYVIYQPSDGFVILHEEKAHNAPLYKCIDIIKEKGMLTYKDYLREAI
jgi:hypothetical protein